MSGPRALGNMNEAIKKWELPSANAWGRQRHGYLCLPLLTVLLRPVLLAFLWPRKTAWALPSFSRMLDTSSIQVGSLQPSLQ